MLARARAPRPLFVLGLPHSGIALAGQYLAHRLPIAYFTQAVAEHPDAACIVTAQQRKQHGPFHSDFRRAVAERGAPVAPADAAAFWGRFFSRERYEGEGALSAAAADTILRSVACVQQQAGSLPFLDANVEHLLRVPGLAALFPRALFLVVERRRSDAALSLFRARAADGRDAGAWLSVRPPHAEDFEALPLPARIAFQMSALERRLERDLAALDASRVLRLDFDAFCLRPEGLVQQVASALPVTPNDHPALECFTCSRHEALNDDERALLEHLRHERR